MADTPTYPQTDWQGHTLYCCPQEGCGYDSFDAAKVTAHIETQHPELVTVKPATAAPVPRATPAPTPRPAATRRAAPKES